MSQKKIVALRILSNQVCIVSLDDARTFADALLDGAVENGAQWSARKSSVLELHTLCRRVIDERATVAKRLKRHNRVLKQLLAIEDVHESLVATLVRQLPDVDQANLEARLATLVESPVTEADRLSEVGIVTWAGAR